MSTSPIDHAPPTDAVRLRRRPDRGNHDPAEVAAVLDAAELVHVAFVDKRPISIPMLHARDGDHLLLHMAGGGRLARRLPGQDIAVSAAIVDALVLARSGLHHSMNYRSVVVLGKAEFVDDLTQRRQALDMIVDRLVPDRRPHLRPMTDSEVKGTAVLRVPLANASVKTRTGGPVDDAQDVHWPVWAGVMPITRGTGSPLPADDLDPGIEIPEHVRQLDPRVVR